jgi:hypothetical protein
MPELRGRIMERVQRMPGVASVSLQVGASVSPLGDIVGIEATNGATLAILKLLDEEGAFESGSVTLSEPTAILAPSHLAELDRQGNEVVDRDVGVAP